MHRLAKAIAGLVTGLERLDALVFTGGIGENSPVVRGLVLGRLGFLGLAEDPAANAAHGRSTGGRISRPGPVQALVVPTDEELMIARDTGHLIADRPAQAPAAQPQPGGNVMARSLLVAPADEDVGLARTCLGLLRALDRSGVHVDYVKPVAQPRADGTPDRSAALVAAVTTLRPPEPLSTAELERQLGEGGLDVVLEKIVATWAPIYNRSDVVVVEGLKARGRPGCTPPPSTRRWPAPSTPTSCWSASGLRSRMALRAWPSNSLSRPADTPRATPRAWSAAWSTACPRPVPRWFSRLCPPRPARRPPPCGPHWIGTSSS